MSNEKQTSDKQQGHAPLAGVGASSFLEVVKKYGYPSQPWVMKNLYMVLIKGIRLDFDITDNKATVCPGGHGTCQSLIARTPDELDQNIQAWLRHR